MFYVQNMLDFSYRKNFIESIKYIERTYTKKSRLSFYDGSYNYLIKTKRFNKVNYKYLIDNYTG